MATIRIHEEDLTSTGFDQDWTDIAYVPGFGSLDVTNPPSGPTLVTSLSQFKTLFGDTPQRFTEDYSYDDQLFSGDDSEVWSTDAYSNTTTNKVMFKTGDYDPGYIYASQLLSAGLPVYYDRVNKIVESAEKKTAFYLGSVTGPDGSTVIVSTNGGIYTENITDVCSAISSNTTPIPWKREDNIYKVDITLPNPNILKNHKVLANSRGKYFEKEEYPIGSEYVQESAVSGGGYSYTITLKDSKSLTQSAPIVGYYENTEVTCSAGSTTTVVISSNTQYTQGSFYLTYFAEFQTGQDWETWDGIFTEDITNYSSIKYDSVTGKYTLSLSIPSSDDAYFISYTDTNAVVLPQFIGIVAKYDVSGRTISGKKMYQEFIGCDHNVENDFEDSVTINTDKSIFNVLYDTGTYRVKYITTGGYPVFEFSFAPENQTNSSTVVEHLVSIAGSTNFEESGLSTSGRGDCILLIDHTNYPGRPLYGDGSVFEVLNDFSSSPLRNVQTLSSFAAMFTPWCEFGLENIDGVTSAELPASFAYLFALAKSLKTNNSWIAIANSRRGKVYNLIDVLTEDVLTNRIANYYQKNAETDTGFSINAITEIYPYGQVIWGNRTLQYATDSDHVTAMGYLNLRNLVCDVKKQCYQAARRYMFEQNSDILWINFKSFITPLLDKMKTSYGLSDYNIKKGAKSGKTKLYAEITLYPIYAVETIDVTISIQDEDVSVS